MQLSTTLEEQNLGEEVKALAPDGQEPIIHLQPVQIQKQEPPAPIAPDQEL